MKQFFVITNNLPLSRELIHFSETKTAYSFKKIAALEEEPDYEKFLELIKSENSLNEVVLCKFDELIYIVWNLI